MAKYNVHAGHNKIVQGASKYLNEVTENRKVNKLVIKYLKELGHTVYNCTDDSGTTQSKNLSNIVAKCNKHSVELDMSNHLNSGGGKGVEVLYVSSDGKKYAEKIAKEISEALDIPNRGAKKRTGLYVLNHTKSVAVIIECCFVDSKNDAEKWDADKCARAIVKAVTGKSVSEEKEEPKKEEPKKESSMPSYKVGKVYTLQDNMKVRTGAGTNHRSKSHSELTTDGKKHDKDKNGCLDKGTEVTCKEVEKVGKDIWIRCPSGWIAAYYNGKTYVR